MEVLVNRRLSPLGRRISRPLIVVLILMLLMGAISILQKKASRSTTDQITSPPQASAEMVSSPTTQPQIAAPVVLSSSVVPEGPAVPGPVIPQPTVVAQAPTTLPTADAVEASQRLDGPSTMPTESEVSSGNLITDAKAKIDAGQLLDARNQLNAALQGGQLDEPQATAVKAMISQINQTVVFGRQRFPDDIYGGVYVVQPGDSLAKIALAHDCTWEFLSRINGIQPKSLRAGATIKIVEGPFFAVVDKKKFTIDLYLGGLPGDASSMYVTTYPVGLGQDDSTPTGTWMIEPHRKLTHPTYYSPRGEGVIAADDPKNPLGGYWIGLSGMQGQAVGKLSYGIHGTIDPDSIGKQSSLGCIRLRTDDIAMVYDMMVEGKSLVLVQE
jgi:lipoprotein-anchoring transpeptidase ErfK/SrfK